MLVPPLVWLIAAEQVHAAFWVFVVAGASDAVDGYVAKRFDSRTHLGAYLDPIADKALLDGIYVALALVGSLPVWLAVLVVLRDLLIVLGVILIQRRDPTFRATPLLVGKLNTFCQILLGGTALAEWAGLITTHALLLPALILLVAATTLVSGAGYAVQALRRVNLEPAG